MRYGIVLLTLLCCFIGLNGMVYGESEGGSRKLLFSTLDVSSAGQYAYLRDGVMSMLVSRLSAKKGLEVLDRKVGRELLAKLKDGSQGDSKMSVEADYLVSGALFAITNGLNIQIVFYPFVSGEKVLRFSVIAADDTEIISKIEILSQDIARRVLGGGEEVLAQGSKGSFRTGAKAFVTVHPEAAYKKGLYSGAVVKIGDSTIKVSARGVKQSKEVPMEMIAMAVGDVDGDGQTELLVTSGSELRIFNFVGRAIKEVARTKFPRSIKVHAMNIADLDNNGKMEIYLSATRELGVSSLVMEWDKLKGFTTTKQNIAWYIRPLNHPLRGMILAGQKRGFERNDFVKKGVFQLLKDDKNQYRATDEIPLPGSVNLFDFVYADIDGDKRFELVVIDQKEKLRIYDHENSLLWVSTDDYGGSKTFIGPASGFAADQQDKVNLTIDEEADRDIVFVPGRIVVVDLDKNGRQDIVVMNNIVSSFRFFNNIRLYDGGSVVGLTWNGTALVETWRTGKQSGYIADFDFSMQKEMNAGSVGEEGVARLYIGQIPKGGSLQSLLPGSEKTSLSLYELGFTLKKHDVE